VDLADGDPPGGRLNAGRFAGFLLDAVLGLHTAYPDTWESRREGVRGGMQPSSAAGGLGEKTDDNVVVAP
jgi:hypothetical protein